VLVEPAKIQSLNKGSKKYTRTRFNASLITILSLTCLTIISATNAVQINLVGQVSTIQDGYTFTLNSGQTIRLADIEIPGVIERGYEQAKTTLANLVNGKTVYLTQSSLYGDIDGRLICVAYVEYDSQNYLNVNKKMIDSGFATPLDTRNDFTPSTWTLLVPKNTQPPTL
jgi:endonuclease YncB( thermonuclease family)